MMLSRRITANIISLRRTTQRPFGTSFYLSAKNLPPRLIIPETDIEESFLKGSGPGGQKINKTNSAVQLKHLPTGTVVKCQETRSRQMNRDIARRLLADKIEHEQNAESSRVTIKAKEAAKKKASKVKKARRKYRKLEEGQSETKDEKVVDVVEPDTASSPSKSEP